jgi:hypothetical protein
MTKAILNLRAKWSEMEDKYVTPPTFGELRTGQKFIALPEPGDNKGHGGFKEAYHLFIKTSDEQAVNNRTGVTSTIPSSMFVIIVKA